MEFQVNGHDITMKEVYDDDGNPIMAVAFLTYNPYCLEWRATKRATNIWVSENDTNPYVADSAQACLTMIIKATL